LSYVARRFLASLPTLPISYQTTKSLIKLKLYFQAEDPHSSAPTKLPKWELSLQSKAGEVWSTLYDCHRIKPIKPNFGLDRPGLTEGRFLFCAPFKICEYWRKMRLTEDAEKV